MKSIEPTVIVSHFQKWENFILKRCETLNLFSKNVFPCFPNSFKMIKDNQLENKVDSNFIQLQPQLHTLAF